MQNFSPDPMKIGQRLQVERKARGLTQHDLANLLGVARTTVVAVEKGERALQSSEIAILSAAWKTSVSDLVRERPVVEPIAPQLRAAAPSKILSQADVDGVNDAAEALRKLGESYLELETLVGRSLVQNYPSAYSLGIMPPLEAAADIAARERSRLGLGNAPVPHLRSILENEVGLRIFLLKLPSRLAGMFAFNIQLGGLIALNAAHPVERRLWTLAHEYWHFLCDRHRADVCALPGVAPRRLNENERLADVFAAHFLMPEAGLKRRFYDLKASRNNELKTGDLLHLKRQYGVTFQALTFRLEELKLLRSGTWKSLSSSGFRVREAEAMVGISTQTEREERLPLRYIELAIEAYERAEITEKQLANFLGCELVEARQVVRDYSREWVVSDEGKTGDLEISLDQELVEAVGS